jgi:hypothetical protein
MNGLKAIAGVLLLVLLFHLCPPDHDPAVAAMPWYLGWLAFIGALTLIVGGIWLMMDGIFDSIPDKKKSNP